MAAYTDTTVFRVKSSKYDQNFSDNISISNHMEIQTGNMPHVCIHCGNSFSSQYDLRTHKKTHAVPGENPYQCSKCDKVFKKINPLESHMKTHTGELPYKCTHCGDSFKREYLLIHHMTVHTGEKPYQCNQCNNGFKRAINLTEHLKTHMEKTSYICSLCDKTFSKESKLVEHMNVTHPTSGEIPYECTHCNKTFNKEHILMRHILTHTTESPYQCSLCDKGFVLEDKYLKHMEIHSDERLDTNSKFDKGLPEESHLKTDAEQETYQCIDGEDQEEAYSINTETSINNVQSPQLDIAPKKVKKTKKKNAHPIDCNSVNMNADNCATFSQAYALACFTEKGDSTSFQRIMKQYSVANSLPVIIHPTPDQEILEFYSRKLVFNK